jgi:hypothetical protein
LHEKIAAGGLECAKGLAAIFVRFVAEVDDHRAANRARDNRMRCISMLPDETVDACE